MFCSTIIPTIGRLTLARAVTSVLDQQLSDDDFEVIVVNDSGQALPNQEWQNDKRVKVFDTPRRRQAVARNMAAAVAGGKYLHFLDDDDWMLPGAFDVFRSLAERAPDAAWLYAGTRFVDRKGEQLFDLQRILQGNILSKVMAGIWIPLQTSMILADSFFAAGCFDSTIPVVEDFEFTRRVAVRGQFACSQKIAGCLAVGPEGSTSNHQLDRSTDLMWRERIFNTRGAYGRMIGSADSSYWHARVVRSYLSSTAWNVLRYKVLTAAGRALCAMRAFFASGASVLNSAYWRALWHTNTGFVW